MRAIDKYIGKYKICADGGANRLYNYVKKRPELQTKFVSSI